MNISDKAHLYAQIRRVLRTGGWLAVHKVIGGSGEPLYLPVLWAHGGVTSFLQSQDEFYETVVKADFRELAWHDTAEWTLTWFQSRQRTPKNPTTNGFELEPVIGDKGRCYNA